MLNLVLLTLVGGNIIALIKPLGVLSGLAVDWKVVMIRYFNCYSVMVNIACLFAIHVLTFLAI